MSRQTPDLRAGVRAALDGAAAGRERDRLKQAFEADPHARAHAEELRQAQAEPLPGLPLEAHEEAKESVRGQELAEPARPRVASAEREPRPVTQPVLMKPPAMLDHRATQSRGTGEETIVTPNPRARSRAALFGTIALLALLITIVAVVANQRPKDQDARPLAAKSTATALFDPSEPANPPPSAVVTATASEAPPPPSAFAAPSASATTSAQRTAPASSTPARSAAPRATTSARAQPPGQSGDWFDGAQD